MAEAPETLEGWYCLHDVRRVDWARWKQLPAAERAEAARAAAEALRFAEHASDAPAGASALYHVLGHKGDLMLVHLRPTPEQLAAVERAVERTRLADFTERVYSYLSITELSLYEASARAGTPDRGQLMQAPFVRRRLMPPIPDVPYICFYPMNKRRGETLNWYAAGMDERRRMMREHGLTGRKYHDRVQQMITGSTGLDDWEWGVTLYARDALDIKKLVYEMRFDEVSAKYAEFGPFRFGIRVSPDELQEMLT